MGIHTRYSLDQAHALGVTFDDLRYKRKKGLEYSEDPQSEAAKQLQVNNVLADYYLYFHRRDRTTPYAVISVGFHRDTFRFARSDNLVTMFNPAASLGLGVERFIRPTWSIDATLRGAWFGQRSGGQWSFHGAAPVAASLQLGIQYYLVK
jgi:hypothetical protein